MTERHAPLPPELSPHQATIWLDLHTHLRGCSDLASLTLTAATPA